MISTAQAPEAESPNEYDYRDLAHARTADGHVVAAWRDTYYLPPGCCVEGHEIFVAVSPDEGWTWSSQRSLGAAQSVTVSAGGQSLVDLFLVRGSPDPLDPATRQLYHRRSTDGGVNFGPEDSAPGRDMPVAATSADGTVAAVVEAALVISVTRSLDGGATWKPVQPALRPGDVLGGDAAGNVYYQHFAHDDSPPTLRAVLGAGGYVSLGKPSHFSDVKPTLRATSLLNVRLPYADWQRLAPGLFFTVMSP